MKELIAYFESLEARITALESRVAELENRQPEVVERVVEVPVEKVVERVVEVPVEKIVEKVVEVPAAPAEQEEPEVEVEFFFDESELESSEASSSETCSSEASSMAPEPVIETPKPAVPLGAVDDLKKAISLGDRFLFVKELFANQGEKLQIAIDELNRLHSLEEANAYIAKHYKWNTESKAYELFQNALKRRFC